MLSDIQLLYASSKELVRIDSTQIRLLCKMLDDQKIAYECFFEKELNQYHVSKYINEICNY